MDFHPLLSALHDNYGEGAPPPTEVTTVRGLLAFCKRWPNNQVEAEELRAPCLSMASRLKAAAKATHADLNANPAMARSMARPAGQTAEAFEVLSEIMEELPDLARDGQVEGFLDALDDYEAERQVVLDAQAEIARQVSGSVCLCPRCGGSGKEPVCAKCGLLRMYPDPKAGERPQGAPVRLSGVYHQVFLAYQGVMAGNQPLEDLIAALVPLEAHLRQAMQVRDRLQQEEAGSDGPAAQTVLRRVSPELGRALKGIDRIRASQDTLRMSDINHGWDDIFDSAVVIEGALKALRPGAGTADAGQLDSVHIRGE